MSSTLALENVLYEKKGAMAYVTVNRPKVLNALNQKTWENLRAAFEGAGGNLKSTISSPIQVHGVTKIPAKRAPELGEHNEEILKELGSNIR